MDDDEESEYESARPPPKQDWRGSKNAPMDRSSPPAPPYEDSAPKPWFGFLEKIKRVLPEQFADKVDELGTTAHETVAAALKQQIECKKFVIYLELQD